MTKCHRANPRLEVSRFSRERWTVRRESRLMPSTLQDKSVRMPIKCRRHLCDSPGRAVLAREQSRNGKASKASGPRTRLPTRCRSQQLQGNNGIDRGLPETHWAPYSRMASRSSTTCRGRPHAAPRLCRARSPIVRRRSSRAWRPREMQDREGKRPQHHAGKPERLSHSPDQSCPTPNLFSVLSTSMNSMPRPYLNVTRWPSPNAA